MFINKIGDIISQYIRDGKNEREDLPCHRMVFIVMAKAKLFGKSVYFFFASQKKEKTKIKVVVNPSVYTAK